MRTYPGTLNEAQRIYNYRVSRARRTVEAIVQAYVCLQNFLQLTAKSAYSLQGFINSEMEDGSVCPGGRRHFIPHVQSGLCYLLKAKGGRQQTNAKDIRRVLRIT